MFNNTNRNTRATLEQILNDQFLEIKAQIQACGSREEAEATLRKVFGNTDGLKVSYFLDANSADEFFEILLNDTDERRAPKNPFEGLFDRITGGGAGCPGCNDTTCAAGPESLTPNDILDMLFGKRSGEAQAPEEDLEPSDIMAQMFVKLQGDNSKPYSEESLKDSGVNLVSSLMNAIPEGSEESYFKLTVEIGGKGATLIGKFLEDQVRKNAEIFAEADENVAIGIKTKFERRVG
jgi:hypothetical protein